MRVNLLFSKSSIGIILLRGYSFGGGKSGSTAILKAFYTMLGITLAKRGHPSSRQGLLLTSINQVLN